MGTVADKLNKVLSTKTDIKNAIIEKGVAVSDSDTFASYGNKIRSITSGGEIPSPFVDAIDLFRKIKTSTGYSPSFKLVGNPYGINSLIDSNSFTTKNDDYSFEYRSYINLLLNILIECSKKNITIMYDTFIQTPLLSSWKSYKAFSGNIDLRDTNDISGSIGYWDLDNAYYIYIEGNTLSPSYKNMFGYNNFEKVKNPRLYAPKCANLYIGANGYDYSDGIFYTPNGSPYELKEEAISLYDENIWQTNIYPKGKCFDYKIKLNSTLNNDLLAQQFPINNTKYTGYITIYQPSGVNNLTNEQKGIISGKGWIFR